jgi:hypothetical protein
MVENSENLERALRLPVARLDLAKAPAIGLVVCGGSALIALGLIKRTARDVDVLALMNSSGDLISPDTHKSVLDLFSQRTLTVRSAVFEFPCSSLAINL